MSCAMLRDSLLHTGPYYISEHVLAKKSQYDSKSRFDSIYNTGFIIHNSFFTHEHF